MLPLWIAAALLGLAAAAFVAWAIRDRGRPARLLLAVVGALVALVALAFIVYAMVVFCEAPPGAACA